ncbi:putative fibrillarin-like [Heracleum sosnowskyi]|uniref:Fibrillarin-like n=1 Tax=Heracleum sosnowskyi TaxID=360622 RepID=A0AAD8MED5_9APIA|nr:putative fibrillarin-like [Heracleum sosnowskyi]
MANAPIFRKRHADKDDNDEFCSPWKIRGTTLGDIDRASGRKATPVYLLFECASGYGLFLAHGINDVDTTTFEAVEEYVNRSPPPFELIDFLRFSSPQDALLQFKAISKLTLPQGLENFLKKNLPQSKRYCCSVAPSNPLLTEMISRKTGHDAQNGIMIDDVMRGLRDKIHKLVGLEPGALEKAQLDLARLHNNTRSRIVVSTSSYLQEEVEVVPHRFEGFFKIKGKENVLCTRNLVPGEALYGEKLIRVQNKKRTEVEYRVWDPLRSKLGAAILGGVTNIWIKPGIRVLYVGNVCGLTVSNLSDLVGLDGLVYVVGFSDGDDVVDMAGKRPNVVTITEKYPYCHGNYRMLVGMVDVIFAEIDHCHDHPPGQLQVLYFKENFIVNNAHFYLRSGGHYMISTQVKDNSNGHVEDPVIRYNRRNQFKPIETVMLDRAYALSVGGYRI